MKLFITKKKLIKYLAEELAYLQIRADWWYYCFPHEMVDRKSNITNQDMASAQIDLVTEVRNIAHGLGILKEVYEEAYKIYDFRNSGKKDFVADVELIEMMYRDFCKQRKDRKLLF